MQQLLADDQVMIIPHEIWLLFLFFRFFFYNSPLHLGEDIIASMIPVPAEFLISKAA